MKIAPYPSACGESFWEAVWERHNAASSAFHGTIIALHGMGSAATEFAPLGEYFSSRGWTVRAPNQRCNGHDPDPRRRGHAFSYADFRADMASYLAHLQSSCRPSLLDGPVFYFGESLGALLLVNYAVENVLLPPPAGLILSAPVVELAHPNPPWVKFVLPLAARLWPRLVINPALFIQGRDAPVPLTRDREYQDYVLTAPHRVSAFSIRFTAGVAGIMERSRKIAPQLRTPLLLLNGGGDVFIRPDQAATWFSTVGSSDKSHEIFPGAGHLLLHELNTEEVLEKIASWIQGRPAPGGS